MQIVGHATINGRDLVRTANVNAMLDPDLDQVLPLQLASVIPPPDVVVTTETRQVSLEPGQQVTVTLHVERQNGYKGRVPCYVKNLPRGVQVVNRWIEWRTGNGNPNQPHLYAAGRGLGQADRAADLRGR